MSVEVTVVVPDDAAEWVRTHPDKVAEFARDQQAREAWTPRRRTEFRTRMQAMHSRPWTDDDEAARNAALDRLRRLAEEAA
jgi:hypothetical protein